MEKTKAKPTTFSEVINADTPVLVDFYTDWCGQDDGAHFAKSEERDG